MPAGQVRVVWNGKKVQAASHQGAIRGLRLASEHLLGAARPETPLREGDLDRSGKAETRPAQLMAAVSFNTVYARRQHEETTWRHPIRGKAKYLEDPFNRERDVMLQIIAVQVRRGMQQGGGGAP